MLLLLPSLALAGWLMARARRLQRNAACRLKGVAPENAAARLARRDGLALAALGCTILALARPQWAPRPYAVERRARDLVIALDVSRSMLAADVVPSRLEAARIAIHEALPALAGQRIALITFAGSAAVRVPLTMDHSFVRYMLDRADPSDMELGSTSLQAAVEKAVGAVLTDAAHGRRDLVLFTDGEDHLSNIDKTAAMLDKCGARVLIVGLGDPVQGARVPAASGPGPWMRYKDAEVVSRLDESTLAKLVGKSSRVTYYPARTHPFDLGTLYQRMIAGDTGDVVVGELREVRHTEGYPYLLGLAAALWLAAAPGRLPAPRLWMLLVLFLPGCGRRVDDGGEAAFRTKFQQGVELLQHAQEQSAVDLSAGRSLLVNAREAYLRAGLLRPGDIPTARQIIVVTRRLRELDARIEKQRGEEKKRGEDLVVVIQRLEKLTVRQARLAQQSAQLLRRRLVPPKADLSDSSDRDNDESTTENGNTDDSRLARPAASEQQAVREGTTGLLDAVRFQQDTLRRILARAYGDTVKQPPTELDPAAELLAGAAAAQQQALAGLVPQAIRWPRVNTAFHTAAGRMEQAIESLRSLQPPSADQKDNVTPPLSDNNDDEDLERPDSDAKGKGSKPVSPGDFTTALSLRSLPVPNYTSAEIMAEESANQQKRARQKAVRAGAKVEKNW
jgi:Ca-activated chloride channel family protein